MVFRALSDGPQSALRVRHSPHAHVLFECFFSPEIVSFHTNIPEKTYHEASHIRLKCRATLNKADHILWSAAQLRKVLRARHGNITAPHRIFLDRTGWPVEVCFPHAATKENIIVFFKQ